MADDTVTTEQPVFQGPALSATSDVPVVEKAVEPPPENTEVNTKTVEAKADDAPPADKADGEDTDTGSEDTGQADEADTAEAGKTKQEIPAFAKREITKARNQKRAADERTAAAEKSAADDRARLDTALKALAERDGNAKKTVVETPRPVRETFDNPEAYDAALVSWAAENAAKTTAAEIRAEEARKAEEGTKATRDAEQKKQAELRIESWNDKRTQFVKDHPDFEDVAESDDLKISPAMSGILLEADNGPELAYALGKDPDLAARISQLSPAKAALEMGKLAASVEAAKKPKVSKTPPPVKPIGSRANAGPKSADEMSMEEYAAMRTPQILAERLGPTARHRAN